MKKKYIEAIKLAKKINPASKLILKIGFVLITAIAMSSIIIFIFWGELGNNPVESRIAVNLFQCSIYCASAIIIPSLFADLLLKRMSIDSEDKDDSL